MANIFIHNLIKIFYVNEGYLPNYPYHMITDKEMFDAFLQEGGFFDENYPCLVASLQEAYDALREDISVRIESFMTDQTALPGWVYAYMFGNVISVNSDIRDIDELFTLTEVPESAAEAEFTPELSEKCYEISCEWIRKQTSTGSQRCATMFGEPHVYKSLRLDQVDILTTP